MIYLPLDSAIAVAAGKKHHEILCAVIQEKWFDWRALTEATLHNVPLRIINHSRADIAMAE